MVSVGHGVDSKKQHPDSEGGGVEVDEEHRTGERRDGVRDPQLGLSRSLRLVRKNNRLVHLNLLECHVTVR